MPSPASRYVQDSRCWTLRLSPHLFYAPELGNDLLSNHWRGKPLDHAGSCCPACRLEIVAALVFCLRQAALKQQNMESALFISLLLSLVLCVPWATNQVKQTESILVIATGMCNERTDPS